jgi:hypothetical protein
MASVGHVVHSDATGSETSTHYFSCSSGPGVVSIKNAPRHITLNLCFLHPVGYAGHAVHFGASGVRNGNTLFFTFGWDRNRFNKKHAGTHYAKLMFLYPVGSMVT